MIPRIRTILFALAAAPDMATLKGDRAGDWSISVSGNWRLTFGIAGGAIVNLNLEDYH